MNAYPLDFFAIEIGALFLLYAEVHFTLKGMYSRLKKKEPEILADAPHRIEPGASLPVLVLIKDAHHYPIQLNTVAIELSSGAERQKNVFDFASQKIAHPLWYQILEISPGNLKGSCRLDVTIEFSKGGVRKIIKNDNYVGASHAPFEVFIAADTLPKTANWYFGEFHCHTNYTNDQVEFGAPLDASAHLAQAMGLHFFCATDHSYDLDDHPDDYLKSDPNLSKWKSLQNEVHSLNRTLPNFVIVPGEEVSAGNAQNRNIHLLILNHPEFLPGAGDGAEKWLRTRPDLSIAEVLQRINSTSTAFAAHPCTRPPFLEWLLVRRGSWQFRDYHHQGLHGLQIWNGVDSGFEEGKKTWIRLLLEGRRLFISAGNDAHGNFNRFRQVGWPFLTMRENHQHLFGAVRTGVLLQTGLSLAALMEGFKNGRMIVTNGPFVDFSLNSETGERVHIGGEISGINAALRLECRSTQEFGALEELRVYRGNLEEKKEEIFFTKKTFSRPFQDTADIPFAGGAGRYYFRSELYSKNGGQTLQCLTNPIWVNAKR